MSPRSLSRDLRLHSLCLFSQPTSLYGLHSKFRQGDYGTSPKSRFLLTFFSTGEQMALCRQAMWSMVGNVGRHVTCVCFRKTVSFIPEELTRQVFIKWHVDYICEWKCNIYYCDCMFSLIHPVFGMKATWFSLCFTQGTWKGCLCLKDDSVKTLTIL